MFNTNWNNLLFFQASLKTFVKFSGVLRQSETIESRSPKSFYNFFFVEPLFSILVSILSITGSVKNQKNYCFFEIFFCLVTFLFHHRLPQKQKVLVSDVFETLFSRNLHSFFLSSAGQWAASYLRKFFNSFFSAASVS